MDESKYSIDIDKYIDNFRIRLDESSGSQKEAEN
jgi:hypothetical protein